MKVQVKPFGKMPDGTVVYCFVLTTSSGIEVTLLEWGAGIQNVTMPDRAGKAGSVLLGYDDLNGYLKAEFIQALTIGPVANRIANAEFTIDGVTYQLEPNYQGIHHLHCQPHGTQAQLWCGRVTKQDWRSAAVTFEYYRRHMQGGFPGNARLVVTYELYENGMLRVAYYAAPDQATPFSMTNHAYWRLGNSSDVLSNELFVNATQYLPVEDGMIPTGHVVTVAETPFDFRRALPIGNQIGSDHPALKAPNGYDVGYHLVTGGSLEVVAASVYAPDTGRKLTLYTDAEALQLFTAQNLAGKLARDGSTLHARQALCLEPGGFTNAINKPIYGKPPIFRPGCPYRQTSIYHFEVV